MSDEFVSEPISDELQSLEEWKRVTLAVNDERGRDGLVEYVTADFHDAFIAEMRARWDRDIARLNSIAEILQA